MNGLKTLNLDQEIFKKVKKHKKVIYIDNEKLKDITPNEKVIIVNNKTGKKKKRIINTVYKSNFKSLKQNLGKKIKYLYPKDYNNDSEVTVITFKRNKKIIRKMLLIVLAVVLVLVVSYLMYVKISNYKTRKLLSKIENVKKEEVNIAIVEINPSVALEVKNNKVIKKGCINDDCIKIYNSIDIINKELNKVIEILYNKAKEEGIDTKDGVKVSSTNTELEKIVKKLSYVKYKKITNEEEKKIVSKVLDNDNIKNQESKKTYNQKLLDTYKKDSDYGKLYTCDLKDNNLSCHFTEKFVKKELNEPVNASDLEYYNYVLRIATVTNAKLVRVLDKFNIKHYGSKIEGLEEYEIVSGIYINNKRHMLLGNACYDSNCYNEFSISVGNTDTFDNFLMAYLPLYKLNLINLEYDKKDVVILNK